MCRITELTSHMLIHLPDSKADELVHKLPGWGTAVYVREGSAWAVRSEIKQPPSRE